MRFTVYFYSDRNGDSAVLLFWFDIENPLIITVESLVLTAPKVSFIIENMIILLSKSGVRLILGVFVSQTRTSSHSYSHTILLSTPRPK